MMRVNMYGLEPGVYTANGTDVVLTDVITHQYHNSEMRALDKPLAVYRDLVYDVTTHLRYSMDVELFKQKFEKV